MRFWKRLRNLWRLSDYDYVPVIAYDGKNITRAEMEAALAVVKKEKKMAQIVVPDDALADFPKET